MRARLLSFGFLVLGACASTSDTASPATIDVAKNTWTFVPFSDALCNDGTSTGIGVYKTDSPNLIIYLQGGGACWDYSTCFTLHTATHGPYQDAQFQTTRVMFEDSALATTAAKSPYATWNKVFVPYCTGDVHTGNNTATYDDGAGTKDTWRHVGRANLDAFMKRVAPTFASITGLAVSGSSAGGFGAMFNYEAIRDRFPKATSVLVDDAGPPLAATAVRESIKTAFATSWGGAPTGSAVCPTCATDWTQFLPTLLAKYPNDRFALLSSLQDETISQFMGLSGAQMEDNLRSIAKTQFDPSPRAKYFYVTGNVHTFLGATGTTTSQGTQLVPWLQAQLDGTAAWTSVLPP